VRTGRSRMDLASTRWQHCPAVGLVYGRGGPRRRRFCPCRVTGRTERIVEGLERRSGCTGGVEREQHRQVVGGGVVSEFSAVHLRMAATVPAGTAAISPRRQPWERSPTQSAAPAGAAANRTHYPSGRMFRPCRGLMQLVGLKSRGFRRGLIAIAPAGAGGPLSRIFQFRIGFHRHSCGIRSVADLWSRDRCHGFRGRWRVRMDLWRLFRLSHVFRRQCCGRDDQ
jgi:hypothetical protein